MLIHFYFLSPRVFNLTLKRLGEPDMISDDTLQQHYLLPKLGYNMVPSPTYSNLPRDTPLTWLPPLGRQPRVKLIPDSTDNTSIVRSEHPPKYAVQQRWTLLPLQSTLKHRIKLAHSRLCCSSAS